MGRYSGSTSGGRKDKGPGILTPAVYGGLGVGYGTPTPMPYKEQSGCKNSLLYLLKGIVPQNIAKCKYNAMKCHFISTLRFCLDSSRLYCP